MSNLDHELTRLDGGEDFLPQRLLLDARCELLRGLVIDVCIQQRFPDFF